MQLSLGEQVRLIGTDLFGSELVRRAMKVFSEGLHNFQVALHGSLRVIPTLEFLQHHCSELGLRDLLVTRKISPSGWKCSTDRHALASAARAASFKRRSVELACGPEIENVGTRRSLAPW